MSKLFIIGNGFDLAHRIPSKYEDFRSYLISLLNEESGKEYSNYDFIVNNDIITSDYIENSVGRLNYDDFSWLYVDESKYDKEERANHINEGIFSPYVDVLKSIPDFFQSGLNI